MDSIPAIFYESVCTLLAEHSVKKLANLDFVESVGVKHMERRHVFSISMRMDEEYQCSYLLYDLDGTPLPDEDLLKLDSRYSRIVYINLEYFKGAAHSFPLEIFEGVVLPRVRSLTVKCTFAQYWDGPNKRGFYDAFYEFFKDCRAFEELEIETFGGSSMEFVKHQIASGRLKSLILNGAWIEECEELIRSHLISPSFKELQIRRSKIELGFESISIFFERWLSGELREGMIQGKTAFRKGLLEELQPELKNFQKLEWQHTKNNTAFRVHYYDECAATFSIR
ncbi:hypothetical protein QR680_004782 [Steinernema hermaphroditum]|uniref:Uncharacterized protein n=1 Tax=Steinernema hermaphroditum TaxID=289476 RepID=A0AA39HPT3_9BILA|nr:hypothetical protein QR680_004782 [Steinernema hermaphroditum]